MSEFEKLRKIIESEIQKEEEKEQLKNYLEDVITKLKTKEVASIDSEELRKMLLKTDLVRDTDLIDVIIEKIK